MYHCLKLLNLSENNKVLEIPSINANISLIIEITKNQLNKAKIS